MELTLSCSRESLKVRPATLEDIPEIMDMYRQFFQQSWSWLCEWDESSAFDMLSGVLANGLLFVSESGQRVTGMIGGLLVPMFFNRQCRVAQELFWWVDPKARGAGTALLDAFESAAKDKGAAATAMNSMQEMRGEAVGRIYERRGYRLIERAYVRVV